MEPEYHEDKESPNFFLPSRYSDNFKFAVSVLAAVLLFVLGVVNVVPSHDPSRRLGLTIQDESPSCKDPIVRQEWRTLDNTQKQIYLKSVQCLWEQPSVLGLNQSLHEDFSWVHSRMGNFCTSVKVWFTKVTNESK